MPDIAPRDRQVISCNCNIIQFCFCIVSSLYGLLLNGLPSFKEIQTPNGKQYQRTPDSQVIIACGIHDRNAVTYRVFYYVRLSVFVCHTVNFAVAFGILNDDYDIQQQGIMCRFKLKEYLILAYLLIYLHIYIVTYYLFTYLFIYIFIYI